MATGEKKKQCFVVSPIGAPGSAERIHADWLYDGIVLPLFREHYSDFDVTRADKIWLPGSIDSQIIEFLLDAELVIADITTLNPNVFYEIGIRHAAKKPVVHLMLDGENIPFDLKIFRHMPFGIKTPQAVEQAKADLKKSVDAVLAAGDNVDNPVTRTRARYEFEKTAKPEDFKVLVQMDELDERLKRLEEDKELPVTFGSLKRGVPQMAVFSIESADGERITAIAPLLVTMVDENIRGAEMIEQEEDRLTFAAPNTSSFNRKLYDLSDQVKNIGNYNVRASRA